MRRTFSIPNPCNEVPFGQFAEVLVYTSVPESRNFNDEGSRHDLVIFGAHLDLTGPAINYFLWPPQNRQKRFHTAVRTRNSSEVTYRRSVASNFIVLIEDGECTRREENWAEPAITGPTTPLPSSTSVPQYGEPSPCSKYSLHFALQKSCERTEHTRSVGRHA